MKLFYALPLFAGLATALSQVLQTKSKSCKNLSIPLTVSSTSLEFSPMPVLRNNRDAAQFAFNGFLKRTATPSLPSGSKNITGTYNINAVFCSPANVTEKASTVQVLSHGIGFDHTYWDLPIAPENYSYVDYFLAQGYSTFSYDRLANGESSYPDPYTVVQSSTELGILHGLTTLLRTSSPSLHLPVVPQKLIHVGHSYGSILSNALATKYPGDSDGLVLTGYSANSSFLSVGLVAWDLQIAALNQPWRWPAGSLDTGYTTWADRSANQVFFLSAPGELFSEEVLDYAETNKGPCSVGTLLTLGLLDLEATAFEGPVQVLTGENDVPFCGGDCNGVLDSSQLLFPKARQVEITLHPNSGHGINLQYNATGAYKAIGSFLSSSGL